MDKELIIEVLKKDYTIEDIKKAIEKYELYDEQGKIYEIKWDKIGESIKKGERAASAFTTIIHLQQEHLKTTWITYLNEMALTLGIDPETYYSIIIIIAILRRWIQ